MYSLYKDKYKMRLTTLMQDLGKIPSDIIQYCFGVVKTLKMNDPLSKTQEHAFFNTVFRYDATTDFFTPENYFGSLIPPIDRLQDDLKPLYDWLISTHFNEHTIFRCQILSSPPGAQILPHTDPRLYHSLSNRVHCVLVTNPGCRNFHFLPEDDYNIEYYHMRANRLYNLDNILPHAAFNYGITDRLHIILDIMPNEFIKQHRNIWVNDTNNTPRHIMDDYVHHVDQITKKYGDEHALKLIYQDGLAKTQSLTIQN